MGDETLDLWKSFDSNLEKEELNLFETYTSPRHFESLHVSIPEKPFATVQLVDSDSQTLPIASAASENSLPSVVDIAENVEQASTAATVIGEPESGASFDEIADQSTQQTLALPSPNDQTIEIAPTRIAGAVSAVDETVEFTDPTARTAEISTEQDQQAPKKRRLPDFRLLSELGRGGMGVVYVAEQRCMERRIAVKTLQRNRDKSLISRFVAEAKVTGFLDHPNIVPVHELRFDSTVGWMLSMKLVSGQSWQELLESEKSESPQSLEQNSEPDRLLRHFEILMGVCNALAFAHAKGIAHCDLKPENIMLGAYGEVLVMDWGVAVDFRSDSDLQSEVHAIPRNKVNAPFGTPIYMAPELATGDGLRIGAHTDVYLLGAILHQILVGTPPHRGRTLKQVLKSAVKSEPPEFPDSVHNELQALCRRALAQNPADRFSDAAEFQNALSTFLAHRQSLLISSLAENNLAVAQQLTMQSNQTAFEQDIHESFAQAISGFKQSQVLWAENSAAKLGEEQARLSYARAALTLGNIGLAESQLHRIKASEGKTELLTKATRLRDINSKARTAQSRIRIIAIGAAMLILLGSLLANYFVNKEKNRAIHAQQEEEKQRKSAEIARDEATTAKNDAIASKLTAEEALRKAERRFFVSRDALNALTIAMTTELRSYSSPQLKRSQRAMLFVAHDRRRKLLDLETNQGSPTNLMLLHDQMRTCIEIIRISVNLGDVATAESHASEAKTIYAHYLERAESVDAIVVERYELIECEVKIRKLKGVNSGILELLDKALKIVLDCKIWPNEEAENEYKCQAYRSWGHFRFLAGQSTTALKAFKKSREFGQKAIKLARNASKRRSHQCMVISTTQAIGRAHYTNKRYDDALAELRRAQQLIQPLAEKYPGAHQFQHLAAEIANETARVFEALGRVPEAIERLEAAHKGYLSLIAKDATNVDLFCQHSEVCFRLGRIYVTRRSSKRAKYLFWQGFDPLNRLIARFPKKKKLLHLCYQAGEELVKAEYREGHFKLVEQRVINPLLDIIRQLMDLNIENKLKSHMGLAIIRFAKNSEHLGNFNEAESRIREAEAIIKIANRLQGNSPQLAMQLGLLYHSMGRILLLNGKAAEAQKILRGPAKSNLEKGLRGLGMRGRSILLENIKFYVLVCDYYSSPTSKKEQVIEQFLSDLERDRAQLAESKRPRNNVLGSIKQLRENFKKVKAAVSKTK